MSVSNHFIFIKSNIFNLYLAFMIAILEQQVRENYEEQLKNSIVNKSN
jgi:hypothetical protein